MSGGPLAILQLLTHYKVNAGGAVQAFLLSRELARLGHRVTMAFAERKGGTRPEIKALVEGIGCRYEGIRLRNISSILRLKDLLRQGYDLVHIHRELALERFLQAAPLAPPVAAVANVGTSKMPRGPRARRLRSRRVDRIVVVAEALKKLLVRVADIDPARIAVVYGAFDEQRFQPDVAPYDRSTAFAMPGDAPLVGMVANLDPKKGHGIFLKAARLVLDRHPDCRFLLAGKGERGKLLALAAAAGVPDDRVLALGFRDDVPRLLRTLDVLVCASTKGEGLTGAVREALALGVPVVSTALAGNVELVHHGATGLLVPAGLAEPLAAAVLQTLDDRRAALARAARARAEVLHRFTSRARAEQMAALYQEIVAYRRVRAMTPESILYPEI